jgi:tetratricopeptide (TPR) repeat protein
MADGALGLERSTDMTSYSPIASGDPGIADRNPRSPADVREEAHPELASLVRQGALKLEAGNDAEAQEYFKKALEIGDRTVGPDHPDLIILLNDLTRIYLRQSAYASAEPLLLRLLEMKRSKGEDHPEVATVLASLATVRQALGRHESAEQLWRRVLDIRERTLAPNHFAIATVLEHFGDACAARGKIREALAAFQRALTIRERTLGSDHSSLRASRERIADLQLQSSDGSLEPLAGAPTAFANDRFRLLSGEPLALTAPAPLTLEKSPATVSRKATAVIHESFSDRPVPESSAVLDEAATTGIATVQPEPAPYREALESIRLELEEELQRPDGRGMLVERSRAIFASALALLGKRQVIAGVVVLVIAMLLVGVATGSRGFGEIDQATALGAPLPTHSALPATSGAALVAAANRETANASVPTLQSALVKGAMPHLRVAEDKSPPKKRTEQAPDTRKVAIPKLSNAFMSGMDSATARAGSTAERADDPIIIQPAPAPLGNRRASFEFGETNTGPQRAKLIGELPTPRLPGELADIEGEVRVRFSVDVQGRPVMSTLVVETSPSPLLTSAVRNVIPRIRFEPARSGGTDSRPIADVVQIGFRFSRNR